MTSATLMESLGVDFRTLSLIAELEAKVVENDILATTPPDRGLRDSREEAQQLALRSLKERWFGSWRSRSRDFLRSCGEGDVFGDDARDTERALKELRDAESPLTACIVLLELTTFDAYWPLQAEDWRSYHGVTIERQAYDRFLAGISTKLGLAERARQMRAHAFDAFRDLVAQGSVTASVFAKTKAGALAERLSSFSSIAFGASLNVPGSTMMSVRLAEDGLGAIAPGAVLAANGAGVLLCGGPIFALGEPSFVQGKTPKSASTDRLTVSAAKFEALMRELLVQKRHGRGFIREALLNYSAIVQWIESTLIDESDYRDEKLDFGALRRSQMILRRGLDRCVEAFNR